VTTTSVTITDVVLAAVVLLVSWILARLARRGVLKLLGNVAGITEDLRQLAARVTFYFLLLLGVGVALTFLGAEIQPVITAAIILGVVVALSLRGIAENFAAGVLIQTRRPIEIGDDIDVLDQSGIVREINGRSVIVEAWDHRQVHIPNRTVLDNPFVNHTARGTRRSEVEVRLAITDSIDQAIAALVETVLAAPGVVATPPPVVLFRSVDPARAVVVVRFAHGPNDAVTVTSAVVRAIADAERSRGRDATVTAPPPVPALTPPATI
jgi:small-conductance mechanosensitive channel